MIHARGLVELMRLKTIRDKANSTEVGVKSFEALTLRITSPGLNLRKKRFNNFGR